MTNLEMTPEQVETVLRAEIAGLLHNIGKLDPNFLASTVPDNDMAAAIASLKEKGLHRPGYQYDRFASPSVALLGSGRDVISDVHLRPDERTLARLLTGITTDEDTKRRYVHAATQFNKFVRGSGPVLAAQENAFQGLPLLQVANDTWALPDLLTLFWDDFFEKDRASVYEPGGAEDPDYTRSSALAPWLKPGIGTDLPRLLILSHGEVSGQEKKGYTPDGKYAEANQVGTAFDRLRQATAFGYEPAAALQWAEWAAWRAEVLAQVPSVWNNPVSGRADFIRLARERLRVGLGDTQRPINEISLWDYASAIAALFKAGVAGAILDGGIPTPSDMRWRFLTLRLDGSEFLFQANQVADLVARRAALSHAYDAMQRALEVDLPLGNTVYRDEDGLLMVVPHLKNLDDDLYKAELEAHVRQALADHDEADRAAGAYVAVSDALPVVTLGEPLRGKKLLPGACLGPASQAMVEPARLAAWWHATGEVCSVCGLRPQGYMEPGLPRYVNASKARERRVCGVCLARRGRRSQVWTEARHDETIWLDEVADHRGQVALVVGRFDLDAWLDGTLIRSLSIGKANDGAQLAKPPTFARIQRVWRTTQDFWETTQVHLAGLLKDDRRRLVIHPRRDLDLGAYHVYDLDLGPTRMSVVWQPGQNRPGCLISADNLGRAARLLGQEADISGSPAASAIAVEDWLNRPAEGGWRVFNPDAANTPVGAIPIERIAVEEDAYATVIPILAEPRTFMALVPANRALDVAQVIRQKYEREMGKVRNRLPLHLGLVFADARQPLRALLDAGRRMLAYPGRPTDERWRVAAVATDGDDCVVRLEEIAASPPPASGGSRRGVTWRAPLKMGDGVTEDNWYPYVFLATEGDDRTGPGRARQFQAPRPGASEPTWLVHVGDLKQDDEVYFTPATLDIQWLDAAARRFEVAYDDAGRRLTMPRRPYLLDDLPRFQALADALGTGLPAASQRHALRDAIEGKRAAWQPQGEELQGGGAFWQFCRDALATADWRGTPPNLDDWADHAARGTLTDILELYERLDLFKQPGAVASGKGAKEENYA